jgi:hypothetical protein
VTSPDGPRPITESSEPADERLERDLEAAFAVPVPPLAAPRLDRAAPGHDRRSSSHPRRLRVGLAIGGVAVALAASTVALPLVGGAGTSSVNAQELVDRSSKASASLAAAGSAYHLVTQAHVRGVQSRTETWFGSRGARTESTQIIGGSGETWGLVDNDAGGWLYRVRGGETLAVRVTDSQSEAPIVVPESLAGTLAAYTAPGCQSAKVTGETTILGRAAWVVAVTRTPETCSKAAAPRPGDRQVIAGRTDLGDVTLAIDKATEVTLNLRMLDDTGAVSYEYEVVAFETGEAAAASGLPYVPPAGATVVDAPDFGSAKLAFQK